MPCGSWPKSATVKSGHGLPCGLGAAGVVGGQVYSLEELSDGEAGRGG